MKNNSDIENFYIEFRRNISVTSGLDYRFPIEKSLYQKITKALETEFSFEFAIDRDVLYFESQYAELILFPASLNHYAHRRPICFKVKGVGQLPGPIGQGQILQVTVVKF